jgi:YhcN/YlaJ family sporulation lipoprotein
MIKKRTYGILTAILIAALMLFVFAACAGQQNKNPNNQQKAVPNRLGTNLNQPLQGNDRSNLLGNNNGLMGNNNNSLMRNNTMGMDRTTAPNNNMQGDIGQKSENINNQLMKMNEIDKVNSVVVGDSCVVGYSPSGTVRDTAALDRAIEQKVRSIDPSIKNVAVSRSADVMQRIRAMAEDITNNQPINNISEEIRKLMQSINPAAR